jgi:hypothetical protein
MNNGIKKVITAILFLLLFAGLIAFEMFNFETTKTALTYIMGTTLFLGISRAAWLALGACAMDFGGLSRMFTAEKRFAKESMEVKAMFLAWLAASFFNAILTWWVIMVALEEAGRTLPTMLVGYEPYIAFGIATFVWLIRILTVFGFATAGDNFDVSFPSFSLPKKGRITSYQPKQPTTAPQALSLKKVR